MAPELWDGAPADRPADLFALGLTAHLLVTGAHPFHAGDLPTLRRALCEAPYRPPELREPREAYYFAAVARLLQKTATARYPHAEALADDLRIITEPLTRVIPVHTWTARMGPLVIKLRHEDAARAEADVIVHDAAPDLSLQDAPALRRLGGQALVDAVAFAAGSAPERAMGEVIWTTPGGLRAGAVAHAVSALDGAVCLQRCLLRLLLDADARGAKIVAAPALGVGRGGVPTDLAAKLLLEGVRTFAELAPVHVREVRFCLPDATARDRWREILRSM